MSYLVKNKFIFLIWWCIIWVLIVLIFNIDIVYAEEPVGNTIDIIANIVKLLDLLGMTDEDYKRWLKYILVAIKYSFMITSVILIILTFANTTIIIANQEQIIEQLEAIESIISKGKIEEFIEQLKEK